MNDRDFNEDTPFSAGKFILEEKICFRDALPFSLKQIICFLVGGSVVFILLFAVCMQWCTDWIVVLSAAFCLYVLIMFTLLIKCISTSMFTPRTVTIETDGVYVSYPGNRRFLGFLNDLKISRSTCPGWDSLFFLSTKRCFLIKIGTFRFVAIGITPQAYSAFEEYFVSCGLNNSKTM
ncbi:MAG: hypothetical protein Q4G59_00170 [Planctomycetia bacterium]|nr:hypothetical protein [Planctomycetia bacterium]